MSKAPPPAPAVDDVVPVARSKKKIIVLGSIALLVVLLIGAGVVLFISKKSSSHKEHKVEPAKPTVFLPLESFTVNLQSDNGDKFLQISMTLQVQDEEQVNLIKTNMPQVRSRLLMLLSSKDAEEILTSDGKKKLINEIVAQVKMPFTPKGEPQKISDVFFTSFVVQ